MGVYTQVYSNKFSPPRTAVSPLAPIVNIAKPLTPEITANAVACSLLKNTSLLRDFVRNTISDTLDTH